MTDSNPIAQADRGLSRLLREVLAIILWTFIVVKAVVFDIDIYLLERYLPSFRWMLNYRFLGLLVIVALLLFGIRKKPFRRFLLYIVAYPMILLILRVPKLLFRNWALLIAFAPAIYDLSRSVRSRFAIVTVAILSTACIALSSNPYVLSVSMVLLGAYLVMHLYRSLRKAYRSSIFEGLGDLVKKMQLTLEGGQQGLWNKEKYSTETKGYKQQCLTFYVLNWGIDILSEKLLKVAKSRKPDLYLILSWLATVLLTSIIYALEYWALWKIDASSFKADYVLSFWSFWGLSFGKLTPSSLSTIIPASGAATAVAYTELFCSLVVLVVLVFSVLTAAREKYREDISDFVSELRGLGRYLEGQFYQLYTVAVAEVEVVLLPENAQLVNQMRKARGLPALSVTKKEEGQDTVEIRK